MPHKVNPKHHAIHLSYNEFVPTKVRTKKKSATLQTGLFPFAAFQHWLFARAALSYMAARSWCSALTNVSMQIRTNIIIMPQYPLLQYNQRSSEIPRILRNSKISLEQRYKRFSPSSFDLKRLKAVSKLREIAEPRL